jgi:hypothetical protein
MEVVMNWELIFKVILAAVFAFIIGGAIWKAMTGKKVGSIFKGPGGSDSGSGRDGDKRTPR